MVIVHSGWLRVSVLYGGPQGLAGEPQVLVEGDGAAFAAGLSLADVDDDGDRDLAFVTSIAGLTYVENTYTPPPPEPAAGG